MKIYSDQRLGVLDAGRELVVRRITKEDGATGPAPWR